MRILFKTPHQVFFRRCFLVREEQIIDEGATLWVRHGIGGRKVTRIPLAGTVVRWFGVKK